MPEIRYLFQHKISLFIKISSLAIGLVIGLVLFSKVAFESSYDRFFKDHDRIYRIEFVADKESGKEQYAGIMAGVASVLADNLPGAEAATTLYRPGDHLLYFNGQEYETRIVYADSSFFKVLDFNIIQGSATGLAQENNLMISKTLAGQLFKGKDPVGQTVLFNKARPYTIIGVFEDVPENCHLSFDAVGSFVNMETQFGFYTGWEGGDLYNGYIKLAKGVETSLLTEEYLGNILVENGPMDWYIQRGLTIKLTLNPVDSIHTKDRTILNRNITFSLLGFAVLFISAMNYILLSLASLGKRAKTIAVKKTAGAGKGTIFGCFARENALVLLFSILMAVALIFSFKSTLEQITSQSINSLFAPERLWVSVSIIGLIFLLAGLIPAGLFSRIPVTHAFSLTGSGNRLWKRSLLGIQIGGSAFIIALLILVSLQYRLMTHKDLGYDYRNLICFSVSDMSPERYNNVKTVLESRPYIRTVSYSNSIPIDQLYGFPVEDPKTGEIMFSSRTMNVAPNYCEMMGFRLSAGRFLAENDPWQNIVVNTSFVNQMHWDDNPVGKQVYFENKPSYTVIGVVSDFHLESLHVAQLPLMIRLMGNSHDRMILSVKALDLSQQTTELIYKDISLLFQDQIVRMRPYHAMALAQYEKEKIFRNIVTISCIAVWIISLTGLIGFMADETFRRRKELAIRKVNGASGRDLLLHLSRGFSVLTSLGITVGLTGFYVTGSHWLNQFAVKVPLSWWVFPITICITYGCIIITLFVQTWKITRENPSNFLVN